MGHKDSGALYKKGAELAEVDAFEKTPRRWEAPMVLAWGMNFLTIRESGGCCPCECHLSYGTAACSTRVATPQ